MATAPTSEKSVTIRILIDKEKNKVVYAAAGKDFVDILLSFLTFPLGTITRLVAQESDIKNVNVGSLNTLYKSVANLGVEHFWTNTSKEMLLQPRNSMEPYCQKLKINIDDTEKMRFFICENWECSRKESGGLLSTFKNKNCKCGRLMNRVVSSKNESILNSDGFFQGMCSFIVFDNLKVVPDNIENCISLPMSLGYEDFNAIQSDTVVIQSTQEVLHLLKCSLVSETPLTDYFLRKKVHKNPRPLKSLPYNFGDTEDNAGEELMKLKVVIRKSKMKVLFVVAEADFVDILFSFLTFPLGGVEYMLKGNTCLGSIDNLYKSVVDLDSHKYFNSPSLKDKLIKTPLAQQFKLQKQILPIDEVPISNYSLRTYGNGRQISRGYLTHAQGNRKEVDTLDDETLVGPLSYLDPHSSTFETYVCGKGFVKSPSLYMVTDNLIVTPTTSVSTVSFFSKSIISPSDLEERVISIGKKECLSLLNASLNSSSALTDGLGQFLYPVKKEKISN